MRDFASIADSTVLPTPVSVPVTNAPCMLLGSPQSDRDSLRSDSHSLTHAAEPSLPAPSVDESRAHRNPRAVAPPRSRLPSRSRRSQSAGSEIRFPPHQVARAHIEPATSIVLYAPAHLESHPAPHPM